MLRPGAGCGHGVEFGADIDEASEADLFAWTKGADGAGLHVLVHAIGDRAISTQLDIFERVAGENGARDRRFRIEHAQHIAPRDFPRFAALGVIASMQPYHAIDDGRWAERVIGPERAKGTYAFRTLLDSGATIAFDAIGGGKLASQILACMEVAAVSKMKEYSRYGSTTHKQVYIYGMLDRGPTELARSYGMAWSVGGWLLTPFLQKIGPAETNKLRQRVVAELKTTFASHYTQEISLREALDPRMMASYARFSTGEKYLINPSLG